MNATDTLPGYADASTQQVAAVRSFRQPDRVLSNARSPARPSLRQSCVVAGPPSSISFRPLGLRLGERKVVTG